MSNSDIKIKAVKDKMKDKEFNKERTESRLNILLGILAISTTFIGILIALIIKMSKAPTFVSI